MSLLKELWSKQLESGADYADDLVTLKSGLVCKVATNKITGQKLFIIRVSPTADQLFFKRRHFQGVSVELLDFTTHKEITIILLDTLLEEIFYLFIDNLFAGIREVPREEDVVRISSNIIFKWKKLFDKINSHLLSPEAQRGLLGELLFITEAIQHGISSKVVIENWFGPDKYNKDFVIGNTGFEIKTTVQSRPAVTISSEKQLDVQELTSLYLKIYMLDEIKGEGITLNSSVNVIYLLVGNDLELRSVFDYQLAAAGYHNEDAAEYTTEYKIVRNELFVVDADFPKLVPQSLPPGVFNCVYCVDITALSACKQESVNLRQLIYG
jgi:hypothetical protein